MNELLRAIPWLAVAAAAVVLLTGLVRRYSLAHAILDKPNARSSHTVPTPRGGGLAIAAEVLGGIAVAMLLGVVPIPAGIGLLGGGVTIALVGWLDDRRGLSSLLRLLVHLVAAAWAAWWIGVPRWLPWSGSAAADSGALAEGLLAALAIAWCTNLYNFMDGIDGIAAAEGVLVAATGALLTAAAGATGAAIVAGLIAAGCAGFLVWNWAPARIFMGDVSSGLLGFLFGAVALLSERSGGPGVLVWALLFGTFVFDATVTLVRRAAHGERWYAAHRSHAYQRLVQSGWGHARVVLAYVAVGLVLAALAALHLRGRLSLAAAYGAALALLAVAYLLVERRRPMGRSGDPAPASGGQPIDPPASSEPW